MGCNQSIPNKKQAHVFKARNLNENDKSVHAVNLIVERSNIQVRTRAGGLMASWPMSCIRKYGYNLSGILFIEAGSGCDTGQGMYLFKCEQNQQIFELVKKFWNELQGEQLCSISSLPIATIPTQPSTGGPSTHEYINCCSNRAGTSDRDYMNGDVRVPLPTPTDPALSFRGSTSSQHNTLPSLPEEPLLQSEERPFPLQPAPTSRKEMMRRRRINSELPTASYSRATDRVTVGMRPSSVNYENSDINGTLSRHQRVSYKKKNDEISIGDLPKTQDLQGIESSLASPTSISAGASVVSLRSDCEMLLTPNSKSSGVGSLNGNTTNSYGHPPPIPPPLLNDPWKRHPLKYKPSIYSCVPHSAREYVNTTNASLDVSGTPLPATAIGGFHFNFDFDVTGFSRRSVSTGADRARLNYVPVEVECSCGASSTSSGIPGTPRTPKTPRTPLSTTEYAIIDRNKTRALSHTQSRRARQRELKSRHTSTEVAIANAV